MNTKHKADIIAWVHAFWIIFGVVSLPLIFLVPWWPKVALTFAGMTILSWIVFRGCWLLKIENTLRKSYDVSEAFEDEAFIQHYLRTLFGIHCSRMTVRVLLYLYMAIVVVVAIVNM